MTKIDIFSGFLGAGKTTLIKKLVSESYKGEKLVLIENEFGDIGIDGAFLRDAGIEITEMNSGCICCTLVGDFDKSLRKVLKDLQPTRILIEPSGVGKLSDVIKAVQNVCDENVVLNSFTTVVDAKKCKMHARNFGEFFINQIEFANCIILSHTTGMSDEKINDVVKMIREHNESATIVVTEWDKLTGQQILDTMEHRNTVADELTRLARERADADAAAHEREHHHHEDGEECECGHHHHEDGEECECEHDHEHEHHHDHDHDHEHHHDHDHDHDHEHEHHHHHADDIFSTWGTETTRKYSVEELEDILGELSDAYSFGTVLRAKGIVADSESDNWIHFDYIPGEIDVRFGPADVIGRLCVIGAGIKEDAVKELFKH